MASKKNLYFEDRLIINSLWLIGFNTNEVIREKRDIRYIGMGFRAAIHTIIRNELILTSILKMTKEELLLNIQEFIEARVTWSDTIQLDWSFETYADKNKPAVEPHTIP